MPFKWKEYYYLASFLSKVTGWEEVSADGARRASVSRAYFAAFGHAKAHAKQQWGFHGSGYGEDHGALRNEFRRQRRREVAERLENLRLWRNKCDYDEQVSNLRDLTINSVQAAREVINLLTYPPDSPVA